MTRPIGYFHLDIAEIRICEETERAITSLTRWRLLMRDYELRLNFVDAAADVTMGCFLLSNNR